MRMNAPKRFIFLTMSLDEILEPLHRKGKAASCFGDSHVRALSLDGDLIT